VSHNPKETTMNKPKLRPLHDQILLRRAKAPEKSEGGIIRPDNIEPKQYEGEVLAVGPGKQLKNGAWQEPPVKPGDWILYSVFQGQSVPRAYDVENQLWLLKCDDLLAVVEK
jgi:chaperonin GroES